MSLYGSAGRKLELLAGDEFHFVKPTHENVMKTIFSWDEKKQESFNNDHFKFALRLFDHAYGELFEDCVATDEETYSYINYQASSGHVGRASGIDTKAELFELKEFREWMRSFSYDGSLKSKHVWTSAPKIEFKSKKDIDDNKIRLFQIPSAHYLVQQHRYGKRVSNRLKGFRWSAMGHNPYRGGTHKIATRLLSKRLRLCYDISGWDKFLPLLVYLYKVKTKNSGLEHDPIWKWIVENLLIQFIMLPDGTVIIKTYGNPSGSGTTTQDNTLCHAIVFMHILVTAYYDKFKDYPDPSLILEQVVYLFGDDNVASVDHKYFDSLLKPGFIAAIFESYGMKLKFLEIGVDLPLEKLSFLGATFIQCDGLWCPQYPVSRLASGMIYENEKASIEDQVMKSFTLTMMSYVSDECELFLAAYNALITNEKVRTLSVSSTVIECFVNLGRLNRSDLRHFYAGTESCRIRKLNLFFCSSELMFRMEDGTKETVMAGKTLQGERLLDNMVINPEYTLSEDGKLWLIGNVDPFHDVEIGVRGFPDVNTARSTCSEIKRQLIISKSPTLPAGKWDCHIALFPILENIVLSKISPRNNNVGKFSFAESYGNLGTLSVTSVASGTPAAWLAVTGTGDN